MLQMGSLLLKILFGTRPKANTTAVRWRKGQTR